MTSVLNVDTIADKAGTGPVALTKQSAAKAWTNVDTSTIRDSFNVSSLTDNSTGNNTHHLTNSMSNQYYSVPSSAEAVHFANVETYATGSFKQRTANSSASATDRSNNVNAVHGDLA